MKNFFKSCFLLVICIFLFIGCTTPVKPKEIKLSFDKSTAYFTSQVALTPIQGDLPAEADDYETAYITVKAENAQKIRLVAEFSDAQIPIDCLKISVDTEVKDFTDGVILFEGSLGEKTERSFLIQIFLSKDAPVSVAGKSLSFNLVLYAV